MGSRVSCAVLCPWEEVIPARVASVVVGVDGFAKLSSLIDTRELVPTKVKGLSAIQTLVFGDDKVITACGCSTIAGAGL